MKKSSCEKSVQKKSKSAAALSLKVTTRNTNGNFELFKLSWILLAYLRKFNL